MSERATFVAVALGVLALAGPWAPRPSRPLPEAGGNPARRSPHRTPPWVGRALAEAGLPLHPRTAWAIARGGAASAVVGTALVAPLLAVVLAAAALAAPVCLRPAVERRWFQRRDAQLPPALEHLAADLRAGGALGPAVAALGDTTPDPLGAELRALAAEVRHGATVPDALHRWSAAPHASADVRLVAAALGLGAHAGGEVARSVDRTATTLRERREIQAEAHALATQARASAGVLAMAPLGFTAVVSGVEPATVGFLTSSAAGVACLAGGLALEAAGAAWMARILRSAS